MDEEFCAVLSEAQAAYSRGLYREAAIRYEQARRIAQAGERPDVAFSLMVDAAGCWHLGGHPLRGLSLVVEALAQFSSNALPRDVWQAKLCSFELMRCFRPDLPMLESCLADIRSLAHEKGVRESAAVLRLEGLLYRARGQHEEALARFERAWRHIGSCGFHPYLIAYGAIFSALPIGDLSTAQRWSEALRNMRDTSLEARAAWLESQAREGLYTNQQDVVCCMARELDELVAKTQQPIWQRRAVMLKVRSWLLISTQDDPMSLSHPMWKVFSQRIEGTPEVFDEYDRVLVLVDARMAALRYALKVQPVDDMYYCQPQHRGTPNPSDRVRSDEIARRVEACHWAIKRAMPIATKLDVAFRCDWRQAELEKRNIRIAELVDWYSGTSWRAALRCVCLISFMTSLISGSEHTVAIAS